MHGGNLIKILVERAAAIDLRGWMEGGGYKRLHGTNSPQGYRAVSIDTRHGAQSTVTATGQTLGLGVWYGKI